MASGTSVSTTLPDPVKPISSAKIFADPFPAIAVRIGDSNDTLKVELDTGSALFWINPEKIQKPSSTTHLTSQAFSIDYTQGNITGHVAADALHIGMLNQLDLEPSRRFGLADTQISDDQKSGGGIIGLSRYDPSKLGYPGGWDMLVPVLNPRLFGLRMQHPLPGTSVEPDTAVGQIDYGAPDAAYVQQGITYTNIVLPKADDGWYINTHGTHVNGMPSGLGGRVALLDTGSTGIVMSAGDAEKVHQLLGGKITKSSDVNKGDQYMLPCNMGSASLEIDIEGKLFAIPNYLLLNAPIQDDLSMCGSWIQAHEDASWVLGSGFLQAVYSVWDYDGKRMGFAAVPPLSQTSGSPGATVQGSKMND